MTSNYNLDYWVSLLCPSSGILEKHAFSKTGSGAKLNHWIEVSSFKRFQLVGAPLSYTWGPKQIQFSKRCVFFRVPDDGQSPKTQLGPFERYNLNPVI
jgi:hypothetical protein